MAKNTIKLGFFFGVEELSKRNSIKKKILTTKEFLKYKNNWKKY